MVRMSDRRPPVTDSDLFYLRSILHNLDELREISMNQIEAAGYGVANETVDDNRDWLDCFVARLLHDQSLGPLAVAQLCS